MSSGLPKQDCRLLHAAPARASSPATPSAFAAAAASAAASAAAFAACNVCTISVDLQGDLFSGMAALQLSRLTAENLAGKTLASKQDHLAAGAAAAGGLPAALGHWHRRWVCIRIGRHRVVVLHQLDQQLLQRQRQGARQQEGKTSA